MLNKETITIFNYVSEGSNESYVKTVINNVFVEYQEGTNLKQYGTLDKYKVYLSIPFDNKYTNIVDYKKLSFSEKLLHYTLEAKKTYIVIGDCPLNYEDFNKKYDFLNELTTSYKYVMVATVDERCHCSKNLWHIEVGAV